MFDLWARDTGIALITAAFAVLILILQLILCFRKKRLAIKLIPAILFTVAAIAFYLIAITSKDWSAFVYIVLAFYSGALLISDGIAWAVWAIIKLVKTKKA